MAGAEPVAVAAVAGLADHFISGKSFKLDAIRRRRL